MNKESNKKREKLVESEYQRVQPHQGGSHTHIHEHENAHKHRHKHKEEHSHSHKEKGRHIHRHEHVHNHQHNHDHGHDDDHNHGHKHSHTGDHVHKHFKHISRNSHKSDKDYERRRSGQVGGHNTERRHSNSGQTKDYHVKSVEEYIGDSGKEFEGAAEEIVESYMGEYMQEYMQGWYSKYCEKTGQFCDQVKLKHATKDKNTNTEIVYNVKSSSGYKESENSEDPREENIQMEGDEDEQYFDVSNKRKNQLRKWKLNSLKNTHEAAGKRGPNKGVDPKKFSYQFLHEKNVADFKKKSNKSVVEDPGFSHVEEEIIEFIPVENGYEAINDFIIE